MRRRTQAKGPRMGATRTDGGNSLMTLREGAGRVFLPGKTNDLTKNLRLVRAYVETLCHGLTCMRADLWFCMFVCILEVTVT